MSTNPQFDQVTVWAKANVYFEGKVVSHTLQLPGGMKKTLGLIYPGQFTFNTAAPEAMEIIAGSCQVRLRGETAWKTYLAGQTFHVSGDSAFDIKVDAGIAEYICSFG